ncbi:MAG: four helix bundle protein [Verrucomicrobia bacterium]|nr:four helix bundle protein [Prolixibacteraceae bacterium]
MKTFREIKVWQKAMDCVTKLYQYTQKFPKEELFGLTSQMRRCAVSVPSNIAEGFGRNSSIDFKRFLKISIGSLYELQTQVEISKNLKYIDEDQFDSLYKDLREIEIMLSSFISSIK